jgi:hypothetical protein
MQSFLGGDSFMAFLLPTDRLRCTGGPAQSPDHHLIVPQKAPGTQLLHALL